MTHGEDVPLQISEYVRLSDVTKIVIGQSSARRRGPFGRPTLTEKLISSAPDVDIHIIPDTLNYTKPHRRRLFLGAEIPSLRDIAVTVLALAVCTAIGFLFDHLGLPDNNIVTVYILGVLMISVLADGVTEQVLMSLAAALEQKSEHPLARAVLQKAQEDNLPPAEVADFQALPGNGLTAVLNGSTLYGGNAKLMQTLGVAVPQKMASSAEALAAQGKTPLFFVKDGTMQGVIAVADVIKEDSPQAVRELQGMGIRVVMLTGDNERTAKAIGAQAGVDEVIAGVLPDGKEAVIRSLKNKGRVAMVGDGINDAPALTRADVGIAIGAGTDVAIDAADVVLMKSRLSDVPAAIRLSRATLHNIHENLFWAFAYNVLGIPLAAGVFIPLLHWQMNPMYGAAAMSLSSFCVVSNALRLNLFDIRSTKHDHKRKAHKTSKKENTTMNKTIKIEGMMCGHCEATVKKALEALDGVSAAEVSHTAGTAVVTLDKPVDDTVLKKAVEDKDYTVTGIE